MLRKLFFVFYTIIIKSVTMHSFCTATRYGRTRSANYIRLSMIFGAIVSDLKLAANRMNVDRTYIIIDLHTARLARNDAMQRYFAD